MMKRMMSMLLLRSSSLSILFLLSGSIFLSRTHLVHGQNISHTIDKAIPMQTLFIPLPETDLHANVFLAVNGSASRQVWTLISVAVSTDQTVIWYDHWEDGFESNLTGFGAALESTSTQIWGDQNASNGCAPMKGMECTDANDVLKAGRTIQIQNKMLVPRPISNKNPILYDGGDKIQSSYPIAVTRGSYPSFPGSVLAGAVEVLDTELWGFDFEVPVGDEKNTMWRLSRMFVMAGMDNTTITLPDSSAIVLNTGQSRSFAVKVGDQVSSTLPIQVDILTGEPNSTFEMRWFSLIATEAWTNDYLTPVGEQFANTRAIVYNPNPTSIVVSYTYWPRNTSNETITEFITVRPRSNNITKVIPDDTGCRLLSNGIFLPFSYTDTLDRSNNGQHRTMGQFFDWGFPIMPTDVLTSQLLVGMGFGCTNNKCEGLVSRSPVWITPVSDAYIFVDYYNSGNISNTVNYTVQQYRSIKIRNHDTTDMSGALIYARAWNRSDPNSIPRVDGVAEVDIAGAWGQDPAVSYPVQDISLDLGTVLVPFKTVHVWKGANATEVIPGIPFRYTIYIMNVGQSSVRRGKFRIVDKLDPAMMYVEGSTSYSTDLGLTYQPISDSAVGTKFPLDGTGFPNMQDLIRRGDVHQITFDVVVDAELLRRMTVWNRGNITQNGKTNLPFSVELPVTLIPNITINNTVYLGSTDSGRNCGIDSYDDVISYDGNNSANTYCFNVTNTGSSYLSNVYVTNRELQYNQTIPGRLYPGQSYMIFLPSTITKQNFTNNVVVVANADYYNGTIVTNGTTATVTATDASTVSYEEPPSSQPSVIPTLSPTMVPSSVPSASPLYAPSASPLYAPSVSPSMAPIMSESPSAIPSDKPTLPLTAPSAAPMSNSSSTAPSIKPSTSIHHVSSSPSSSPSATIFDPVAPSTSPTKFGVPRNGNKCNPFDPAMVCNATCMEDVHNAQTNTDTTLVCRAREVVLRDIRSGPAATTTCSFGEIIVIDLIADIELLPISSNSTSNGTSSTVRYDFGWYIATDGGDALTGECAINSLSEGASTSATKYTIVPPTNNITWSSSTFPNETDVCGDITSIGDNPTTIEQIHLASSLALKCEDINSDGYLDVSICFTWRDGATNDKCNPSALHPGSLTECDCATYDIPNVVVTTPGRTHQHLNCL